MNDETHDPELERLLKRAQKHVMTDEEVAAQRASWVRGEMAIGTDKDEAEYRALLAARKEAE